MHIALCDSDAGDRKQMERLLSRESDKRKNNTGVFYIDTFGSSDTLLQNPLVYDAYFLDVTDDTCNSYHIASSLREKGIGSPIVFCISSVNFRNGYPLLANSVFLDKPIKVNDLSLVLDEIILQKKEQSIPKIELRNHNETFYLEEREILYVSGNGYGMDVYLTDGRKLYATAFIENFWMELTPFPSLFLANKKTIINAHHVKSLSAFQVTLTNGVTVKITPMKSCALKKVMAK